MEKSTGNEMVIGLDINEKYCDDFENICEVCLEAKKTGLPFNSERRRSTKPLEIIHADIVGLIDPVIFDMRKNILTVLDDLTHYTVVYSSKHKSKTHEYLKK
ncbi:hypothetical protein JTB14_026240 [Gonioctena quinquepunctata]|nr:hypothetical protein JTB14_026240 [Gonioctena quinquepunctata]